MASDLAYVNDQLNVDNHNGNEQPKQPQTPYRSNTDFRKENEDGTDAQMATDPTSTKN